MRTVLTVIFKDSSSSSIPARHPTLLIVPLKASGGKCKKQGTLSKSKPNSESSSSSYLRGLKLSIEGKNPSLFLALPLSNLSLFLTGADELA